MMKAADKESRGNGARLDQERRWERVSSCINIGQPYLQHQHLLSVITGEVTLPHPRQVHFTVYTSTSQLKEYSDCSRWYDSMLESYTLPRSNSNSPQFVQRYTALSTFWKLWVPFISQISSMKFQRWISQNTRKRNQNYLHIEIPLEVIQQIWHVLFCYSLV